MRSPLLLLFAVVLSPAAASAQSAEYRTLSLLDGRSLTGEVTESLAEGMMLTSKQGSALVRYDQLAGIEVIDASTARAAMPWQVALAPVAGADGTALDEWLPEAASGMPGVAWIHGEQWGAEARVCAGVIECLVEKARTRSAEYLLAPVYDAEAQRLVLRGVHLAQGAAIGEAGLLVPEDKKDAAPALLGGVFTALGMRPDVDLMTASRGGASVAVASPIEPKPAPVEVAPEPVAEPVAEMKTRPTSKPASTPKAKAQTRVVRVAPSTSFRRSRGAAFALGFAPIPGISSAYVGDPAGVVVSLVGTLSLGALSVYTLGSTVRWKDPFIASSVLVPYALNVLFNQITGQVGWNRLYGNVSVTSKRPVAGIAPLFAVDARRPTGAALTLAGRF